MADSKRFSALTSVDGLGINDSDGFPFTHSADSVDYKLPLSQMQADPVGTCDTAGGTTEKTVTLTNYADFTLVTGRKILVTFTNANTASTPSLNVNGTGAYFITVRGQQVGAYAWRDGAIHTFIFTGTYWECISSDIIKASYDTDGYVKHADGSITYIDSSVEKKLEEIIYSTEIDTDTDNVIALTLSNFTLSSGTKLHILFQKSCHGSTAPVIQINGGTTSYSIKVTKAGSVADLSTVTVSSVVYYWQAYTALDLVYDSSVDAFVILDNPVIYADYDSTTGYVIKADGSNDRTILSYTLWGGRNLIKVLGVSSLAEAITWLNTNKANPTAWVSKGIRVGDYLDVSSSGFAVESQRVAIAQCDFDGFYYSSYNPCIWFTFVNCISLQQHHTTNTNSGGYPSSDIRTYLNDTVYNALVALGFDIRTANILEETDSGTSWGWRDEKVFLPTETQVFGHGSWGDKSSLGYTANIGQPNQLDYYRLRPNNRKKYYKGSNHWWWLQNPAWKYSDSSVCFCDASAIGNADFGSASGSGGVSPLFIL